MKVKILFFASLSDYTGMKNIEMEVPEGITVEKLKEILTEKFPRMATAQKSIMTAVNREYADGEQKIPMDAEIAFFPPVSGG